MHPCVIRHFSLPHSLFLSHPQSVKIKFHCNIVILRIDIPFWYLSFHTLFLFCFTFFHFICNLLVASVLRWLGAKATDYDEWREKISIAIHQVLVFANGRSKYLQIPLTSDCSDKTCPFPKTSSIYWLCCLPCQCAHRTIHQIRAVNSTGYS